MVSAVLQFPTKPVSFTQEDFTRCFHDPVYFVETFGYTFDPRPEAYPHHLPFKLYPFQKELLLDCIKRIQEGRGLLIEKSRDMGASWVVLYAVLWCWLFMQGFQALIGSRKEDLVDNKTLDSLFGKLEYALDRLPFIPDGYDTSCRTHMKITNPMNGNTIIGESANKNFGRQGRYRVALMDELAFWESPELSWASCGESTRCRIAITTPPERINFVKYLRFSGIVDVTTLHWRLHPLKDEVWYQKMKGEKTSEELAREVDINWEGAITGRVYPEVSHIRFGQFPYRPDWPLYPTHDPGHHPDPHAIGWFQVDPGSGRYRIVEAFEVANKVAEWFLPLFGHTIDSQFSYTPDELLFIEHVRDWKRGQHFGDVAGRQTNQVSGTSVYDVWSTFGIYVNSNTMANDLESRKTAARRILQNLDVNDTKGCRYFLECIKSARYPDLGEHSNRITPNDKPIHDWSSHMRTVLEYFAVNINWSPYEEQMEGDTFGKALASVQSRYEDY